MRPWVADVENGEKSHEIHNNHKLYSFITLSTSRMFSLLFLFVAATVIVDVVKAVSADSGFCGCLVPVKDGPTFAAGATAGTTWFDDAEAPLHDCRFESSAPNLDTTGCTVPTRWKLRDSSSHTKHTLTL